MSDFGYKYTKIRPTKEYKQEPASKKRFGKHQENYAIFWYAVDKIILQEKEQLILKDETQKNIDYEVNEDEL